MQKTQWEEQLLAFGQELSNNERSKGTIEKYLRDVRRFFLWLGDEALGKEQSAAFKEHLMQAGYMPVTINSMLSSLNGFFRFIHREDCKIRFLRIQRKAFRDSARELGRTEYRRLLLAAEERGNQRLKLLMETICACGIRVSELEYITVEAVTRGQATIALKGKIRTILLPGKLCSKLQKYAKKEKIVSGALFRTRSGHSLSRRQIWKEMKQLCIHAQVDPHKVFPHNLRHLFASTFYQSCKDLVKLADILGHSNLETTRIYLLTTGREHRRQLERLGLIS